jgi:hypothetical protein
MVQTNTIYLVIIFNYVKIATRFDYQEPDTIKKGKAIQLQAWTGR